MTELSDFGSGARVGRVERKSFFDLPRRVQPSVGLEQRAPVDLSHPHLLRLQLDRSSARSRLPPRFGGSVWQGVAESDVSEARCGE